MTAPSTPHPLSSLSDPGSLAKLQILLVPINTPSSSISAHTYTHWSSLIKRHVVLRGDELARPLPPAPSSHTRGGTGNPRTRFLPASSSTSISKGGAPNHVHLAYPAHPPARHLSNLSLLRISAFPLVVLGIATAEDEPAEGYNVNDDDEGDIAGSSKASAMAEIGGGLEGSFGETLAGLFPPTSPFPLVKRLIVVPKDTPAPDSSHSSPKKNGDGARGAATSGYSKGKAGVEVVHAPTEGVEGWLGRLLGEVVGDVLGELGELVGGPLSPMSISILTLGNCIGNSSRPQDALIDIATLAHVHASSSAPRNPFPGPVNVIYTHAGPSSRSLYHTCVHLQLTICRHTIYPERPRYISHACPHARWSTHFCRSAIFASDSNERHRSHSSAGTPIGIV